LDLKAIAAFWNSDAGGKIRQARGERKARTGVHGKIQSEGIGSEILGEKTAARFENEFVVVQGVADLVVLLPEEIWLVDFKTDEIRANELAGKLKFIEPQLKLYASALAKIYSRPVTNCWLHFLSARKLWT
jgi:ATP-dependent exoDNAse (exonuclease V) beta subunit